MVRDLTETFLFENMGSHTIDTTQRKTKTKKKNQTTKGMVESLQALFFSFISFQRTIRKLLGID